MGATFEELRPIIETFLAMTGSTLRIAGDDFLPCLYPDDSYRMLDMILGDRVYVARIEFVARQVSRIECHGETIELEPDSPQALSVPFATLPAGLYQRLRQ